jgi:hypothetical protein
VHLVQQIHPVLQWRKTPNAQTAAALARDGCALSITTTLSIHLCLTPFQVRRWEHIQAFFQLQQSHGEKCRDYQHPFQIFHRLKPLSLNTNTTLTRLVIVFNAQAQLS